MHISGGYIRYVFNVGEAGHNGLSLGVDSGTLATTAETIYIRALERHPVNPGTPRQRARIITVGGTERSVGSLHVASPAAPPVE